MKGKPGPQLMDRRGRKDEPFNPFAPNADKKARVRKEQRARRAPRPEAPTQTRPNPKQDLAVKQRAALAELAKRQAAVQTPVEPKPTPKVEPPVKPDPKPVPEVKPVPTQKIEPKPVSKVEPKPKPTPKPVAKPAPAPVHVPKPRAVPKPRSPPKMEKKVGDNREDRLAALRAKSAATAEFAKAAQDAKRGIVEPVMIEVVEVEPIIEEVKVVVQPKKKVISAGVSNVFKTIEATQKKKPDKRPKRKKFGEQKGGGRQPQTRKLDRRKYLEYKYVAKDLLDNDAVKEENRSNVLGQIWAKGERVGIEDALKFIDQKETELIIPTEVADAFRKIVKRYTTKR